MVKSKKQNNGESHDIRLIELKVDWQGSEYLLTPAKVIEAFENSGYEGLSDSKSRYFIEIHNDLKTVQAVFGRIVPVPSDVISPAMIKKMSAILEGLGFEILDRKKHHE